MTHCHDILHGVVRPVLKQLDMGLPANLPPLHTKAAEQLVLATGAHESGYKYLYQIGGGPALGYWQMEPATYTDHWNRYLHRQSELTDRIATLTARYPPGPMQMVANLAYACAMCRIHYYRRPEALPPADDAEAIGKYWKEHYNTEAGAGTVPSFVLTFNEHVKLLYQ